MSAFVNIVTGGGIGDSLLALRVHNLLLKQQKSSLIYTCARDEVFNAFKFILDGITVPKQLPPESFEEFLNNDEKLKREIDSSGVNDITMVVPDLICSNHPRLFDYKKYNLTLQTVRSTRTLMDKWKPEKIVYLGLLSNTTGYSYYDIGNLAKELGNTLPDFTIYLPILQGWDRKPIPFIKTPENLPGNVHLDHSPDLIENIKMAYKSYYIVSADNLFSHLAFDLGCRRLVLDSRYPLNKNSQPWGARWSEDINDHINIENFPADIARLIKTNIEIEQTNLLPKSYVLKNLNSNWKKELLFKY